MVAELSPARLNSAKQPNRITANRQYPSQERRPDQRMFIFADPCPCESVAQLFAAVFASWASTPAAQALANEKSMFVAPTVFTYSPTTVSFE